MYTYWLSRETRLPLSLDHQGDDLDPESGPTWEMMVRQLQPVDREESVGYGRTWTARRTRQLAEIPIGYVNGFSSSAGDRGSVLIQGCSAPVVGRARKKTLMAGVTDNPVVSVGAKEVLIGRQGNKGVQAEEPALLNDAISNECLVRRSPTDSPSMV